MEKTWKEKVAEKTSELLRKNRINYVFRLKGPQRMALKNFPPYYPTASTILEIIEAYEKAKRIVAEEEAFELTQRFAHELPGVVDWKTDHT